MSEDRTADAGPEPSDAQGPKEGTVVRIPPRMFEGDTFYLPCRAEDATFELSIARSDLKDPALQVLIAAEMEGDGYEIRERRALVSRMGSGDLFLDVGAHRGIFTLHAAAAVPTLRVIAVEPASPNVASLEDAIRRNGVTEQIRVARVAAGAADGNISLRHNTSMGHHVFSDAAAAGPGSSTVVQLTLDTLVAHAMGGGDAPAGRIWMKIDVEGRELDVLRGAKGLIDSGRVFGILWEYMVHDRPSPRLKETEDWLADAGYETEIISNANRLSLKKI